MTIGPATILGLVAGALATLAWWVLRRLGAPEWAALLIFGVILVVVVLAGPLVRLP